MKVQSESKVQRKISPIFHPTQLNADTSFDSANLTKQMPQTKMRSEDLDNIEESLRNDLRREGHRHVINPNLNQDKMTYENSITHRHNYLNICDQNQAENLRNIPNITENFRPHPVGQSPSIRGSSISLSSDTSQEASRSNVEDFKRYCSLLTERIQKVEEQNTQLLRIAEQQRMEYDKVVAQVVESEQSQRHLINECSNLRHQVQKLASHNENLTDQRSDSHQACGSSFTNETHVPCEGAVMSGPVRLLRTSPNPEQITDVLKHLRSKPENILKSCNPADLSAAVGLCAALQLASQSNHQVAETPEISRSPQHAQPKGNSELGVIPESSVYASHTNVCDSSTTALNERNITRIQQTQRDGHLTATSCKPTPRHPVYQRQHFSSDKHQSFNNNSSDDSSSKLHHNFHAHQAVPDTRNSLEIFGNLRCDSRLRRSHTHLTASPVKARERQRPSSLIMDVDFSQYGRLHDNAIENQQIYNVPARSLSPMSPPTSPTNFKQVPFQDKCAKHNLSTLSGSCAELSDRGTPTNIWLRRTSMSSSSLLDNTSNESQERGFHNEPKEVFPDSKKSFSKKDLSHLTQNTPLFMPVSSNVKANLVEMNNVDATSGLADENRIKTDENNLTQFKINEGLSDKSNLRKNIARRHDKKDNSALARRRHSYGRACRKSQPLDLLGGPVEATKLIPIVVTESNNINKDNSTYDNDLSATSVVSKPTSNVQNLDDSGFASPSVISSQNQITESKLTSCSKNKQERQRPPKPIRSHLRKKVLSNESQQAPTEHIDSQSQEKSIQSFTDNHENVIKKKLVNESIILPSGRSFSTRRYSEGSAASKKRNKLLSESERRQVKRQTSVGNDMKFKEKVQSQTSPSPLSFKLSTDSTSSSERKVETASVSQLPFVTSKNSKLSTQSQDSQRAKENNDYIPDEKDIVKPERNSNLKTVEKTSKSLKEPHGFSSPQKLKVASPESISTTSDKSKSVLEDAQKQNKTKLSKKNKSSPLINRESKKHGSPGGNQGKSLVHLMKSKFTRGSSSSKLSTSTKKKQLEPSKRTDGPIIAPPTTPTIKPVLSLENVSYLPPGKDGDSARKSTKQKMSETLRDHDAAQTIESCANLDMEDDLSKHSERKTSDELLSDEGFADSSTIERSETEEYQQLPDDIEMLRSKMFALPGSTNETKTNTVSSTESENSECNSLQQKEKTKRYNLNTFIESKGNDKKSSLGRDFETEVYATEVTLVPTSALQKPNHSVPSSSKLKSKKIQKPTSGNALGRLLKKTVSNHSSGSKEDLSQNKDVSTNQTQAKDTRKNKLSGYQRDMEQAFMSSIVQAELKQGLREENRTAMEDAEDLEQYNLPYASANMDGVKIGGSIGSGSSISSLPSVGSASTNSGDSLTSNSSTSQQLPKSYVIPRTEKTNSIKLPGFGVASDKKVTKGTTTPPSNPEFKAKDKKIAKEPAFVQAPELEAIKTSDISKSSYEGNRGTKNDSRLKAPHTAAFIPQKNSKLHSPSSKLTKPSNLSPVLKASNLQKNKIKTPEKSSPTFRINQTAAKTRLAPLNYGFSPIVDKSSQKSKRNSKPLLRIPIPRSTTKSSSSQVEGSKARSSIPSTGLFRPKPVYNGV